MSAKVGRPRSCDCGECFKCRRADYMRGWWNKLTPEQKREKTAQRDPDRVRESDRQKMAKRRANPTPEQKLRLDAYRAVHKARMRGDLTPEPCEECGSTDRLHAHHEDYTKPLEIRWLCNDCHVAHHHGEQQAA